MGCCGENRNGSDSRTRKTIKIIYLGDATTFKIVGPMTNRIYRFRGKNSTVIMDIRDWDTIDIADIAPAADAIE